MSKSRRENAEQDDRELDQDRRVHGVGLLALVVVDP
jgi:hypothetical protein